MWEGVGSFVSGLGQTWASIQTTKENIKTQKAQREAMAAQVELLRAQAAMPKTTTNTSMGMSGDTIKYVIIGILALSAVLIVKRA